MTTSTEWGEQQEQVDIIVIIGNLGVALSFVTQYDVNLILEIEKVTSKKLEELKCEDDEVLNCLSIVSNASKIVKLVTTMSLII